MNFKMRARVALVAVAVAAGGISVANSGIAVADPTGVLYPSEEACQMAKPARKASTDPIYNCEYTGNGTWRMNTW